MKRFLSVILALVTLALCVQPAAAQWRPGRLVGSGLTLYSTTPPVVYDSDAQALFNAFAVPPSTTDKGRINTVFTSLKAQGLYTLLDDWSCATQDQQSSLLKWKSLGTMTLIGSPVFTPYFGFQFDGSTNGIDTGHAPSTFGGQCTLNSCTIAGYANVGAPANNSAFSMGVTVGGGSSLYYRARDLTNQITIRVNQSSSSFPASTSVTSAVGFTVATRNDAATVQGYKNGVNMGATAMGSSSLPTGSIYLGGYNLAGVLTNGRADRMACWLIAANVSSGQQVALYNVFLTYLTAYGAN